MGGHAVSLGHGVVLDPDGWASRLARALQDARRARDASLRDLARESGGRFRARDLRQFERGLRPVGDRLSPLLADLYEIELGGIAPPDRALEVDLDANVLRAGGAIRKIEGDGDLVRGALAAYLDLVWALRGGARTQVSLRHGDVEVLGEVLALDEERVVEHLVELMQVSRGEARTLLLQLRHSPLVVPAAIAVLVGVGAGLTQFGGGEASGRPGLVRVAASPDTPLSASAIPSARASRLPTGLVVTIQPTPESASARLAGGTHRAGSDAGFSTGPADRSGQAPAPNGAAYGEGTHVASAADAATNTATDAGGGVTVGEGAGDATNDSGPAGSGEQTGAGDPPAGAGDTGDTEVADTASAGAVDSDAPPSGAGGESDGTTGVAAPDDTADDASEDAPSSSDDRTSDMPPGDSPSSDLSAGGTPTDETPVSGAPSSASPADDPPAAETPASETPASETPAGDTPAGDTPSDEAPANNSPADETPASNTPDTPLSDPPSSDPPSSDTPAGDTPAGDPSSSDAPAEDPPATNPPSSDPQPTSPAPSGSKGNQGKSEYAPGHGGDGWGTGKK